MAESVREIMVLAAETAEAWICAGSTVGAAGAQALRRSASIAAANKKRCIFCLHVKSEFQGARTAKSLAL
jgi:hypothetical protein